MVEDIYDLFSEPDDLYLLPLSRQKVDVVPSPGHPVFEDVSPGPGAQLHHKDG